MLLKSARARLAVGALVLPLLTVAINPPGASAAEVRMQAVADVTSAKAGPASPGRFNGYGFDTCQAPDQATMDALRRESPFWGVGIYIGGDERSCAQPNLTRAWVQSQRSRGWKLFAVWAGPQSHCADATFETLIKRALGAARNQGAREAVRAINAAKRLGMAKGSTLFMDLEAYDNTVNGCTPPAFSYMSGWNKTLAENGFKGGLYAAAASGINVLNQVKHESPKAYVWPTSVWISHADDKATTHTRYLSDSEYRHQRLRQYSIDVTRTYGSITLDLDLNMIDIGGGSVAPKRRPSCGVSLDFPRYKVLRTGSNGPQVKALQCLLKRTKDYGGKVTGHYTLRTAVAVGRFQRSIAVTPNRKVGSGTWAALHSHGSLALLKRGSASDRVRSLQRALTAALGRRVEPTGVFSAGTTTAVRRYQANVGIDANGIVATSTWRSLQHAER